MVDGLGESRGAGRRRRRQSAGAIPQRRRAGADVANKARFGVVLRRAPSISGRIARSAYGPRVHAQHMLAAIDARQHRAGGHDRLRVAHDELGDERGHVPDPKIVSGARHHPEGRSGSGGRRSVRLRSRLCAGRRRRGGQRADRSYDRQDRWPLHGLPLSPKAARIRRPATSSPSGRRPKSRLCDVARLPSEPNESISSPLERMVLRWRHTRRTKLGTVVRSTGYTHCDRALAARHGVSARYTGSGAVNRFFILCYAPRGAGV